MNWQPIATAPKDGTEIWLAGRWLSGAWDIKSGHYLVTRFNFAGEGAPTHWATKEPAPLPNMNTTPEHGVNK